LEGNNTGELSDEFADLREKVIYALGYIEPAGKPRSDNEPKALMLSSTTRGSKSLPSHYLVYFLLVDLLRFPNMGAWEKSAWTVPIRYQSRLYAIEHQKMGLRICAPSEDPGARFSGQPSEQQQEDSEQIARKVRSAVKVAKPYFEWLANEAAKHSALNVLNHSLHLHERYLFLVDLYKEKLKEADSRKDEQIRTQYSANSWGVTFPYHRLKNEADWLALSSIDAFYSFTEHVFIHAAVVKGVLVTGEDVANLSDSDWGSKFKACLNVTDPEVKKHYDRLVSIKQQIRNYMAHGAFGKSGEAFQFHSGAGAVPLLINHQKGNTRFSMQIGVTFDNEEAIQAISDFMDYYWQSNRFPEVIYIQSTLPSILPFASDSTYAKAMESIEDMENLVGYLARAQDDAANMDW
jgi:hypothetical protein